MKRFRPIPLTCTVAASLIFVGVVAQAKAEPPQLPPAPRLAFPFPPRGRFQRETPSPKGNPMLRNLHFAAIGEEKFGTWLTMGDKIRGTYTNRILTLYYDTKSQILWKGTPANTLFTVETTSIYHTLKDKQGRVLWSDARTQPVPDLTLYKEASGQARLVDKNQKSLWTGALLSSRGHSVLTRSGSTYRAQMGGIVVDGGSQGFTVKSDDGTLLWSGQLPVRPVVVVRDKNRTSFSTPSLSGTYNDSVDKVSFVGETATVTIHTLDGKILGTQQAEILKLSRLRQTVGVPFARPAVWRTEYKMPQPSLDVNGTLLLTYKDRTGKTIARHKVYRDGGAYGFAGY